MSSDNQGFVNQYVHHSSEPLGLHNEGAGVPESAVPEVPSDNGEKDSFPQDDYNKGLGEPHQLSPEAERAFNKVLYPSDSFTSDGTYWADLPLFRRAGFACAQYHQVVTNEFRNVWRMFVNDPMSPLAAYSHYMINGLGMFVEGYTLFSVGNLKALFGKTWPECWASSDDLKKHYHLSDKVCQDGWLHAVNYLQTVGIICGQVLVGFEGDWVGRRFGMVQDALIMTLGSVMLTAMWGITLNGWVICYAWSLFIYGIGVGGEYPMTSTRAMEVTASPFDPVASTGDRLHRGRNVLLAFLMQGWGQFADQVILILMLLITHHGNLSVHEGDDYFATYTKSSVQWTFRVSFAIIAVVTFFLAYYRYYKIKYADQSLAEAKQRLNTSGYDLKSLNLAIKHYWHRLIATCSNWFFNDFFFYGNKIFQGTFIKAITGSPDLKMTWLYNLINIGVALAGYYCAALFIDHKLIGRKWMQACAFIATFALFNGPAWAFDSLTDQNDMPRVHAFQFIYFMSSFFNQFGYNSTTFLLAAEVYPASIRASCHGVAAAFGKLGALVPAIIYDHVDGTRIKMLVAMWFGLAGFIMTVCFIPDTTGLDLREQERYWEYVIAGREQDYHGVAVHPHHLSWFEIFVLRRHLAYNPELDRQQKLAEFREIYQSTVRQPETDLTLQQKEFLHSELGGVFDKEFNPNSAGHNLHEAKLGGLEKEL